MGVIRGLDSLPPRKEPYEVVDADVVETADVCVIGSGAGGAVVTHALAAAGKSVVLLERGGYYEGRDMNQRDLDMVPLLWRNGGFNFDDSMKIAIAQGSCLGGSTVINDAVCFDPPDRVRAEWRSLGMDFSEEEWARHTALVREMIRVSPVGEEELNRNNRMLREGAKKLGLRDHWPNHRNCVNCMQCGFCHNGCHYETKQDVRVTFLHQALQATGAVRIYCNCAAERLAVSPGRVDGVEGSFLDVDGKEKYRIRVNARAVVVSAGAITSSHLLLANRIASSTAGRGVVLHPSVLVVGQFPYEIKPNQGIPMAYSVHDFGVNRRQEETRQEYGVQDVEFMIESISLPMFEFSMGMPGGPLEHHEFLTKFNQLAMAGMMSRDQSRGRVSLGENNRLSFHYDLGPGDRKALAKASEITGRMWFALGAERIATRHPALPFIDRPEDLDRLTQAFLNDGERVKLVSSHPQSGNPIGSDPSHSVVDPDCRVHGYSNLLVADASVFPNAVGVNPQLTVMIVASMAAARMLRDWDRRYGTLAPSADSGRAGSAMHPMYHRRDALARQFNDARHGRPLTALYGPTDGRPTPATWSIDPSTLEVTNDSRWRGFFARDEKRPSGFPLFGAGFYRQFQSDRTGATGTAHPVLTDTFAHSKVSELNSGPFAPCLLVEYLDPPHNRYNEVLKVVDDRLILGRLFEGSPEAAGGGLDFVLARRYPFEFLTPDDHDMLFAGSKKPDPARLDGRWEGQLVGESGWSPTVFQYRFHEKSGTLENQYRFGSTGGASAPVLDRGDHLETHPGGASFTDELRGVRDDWLVGRLHAPADQLSGWVPTPSEWAPVAGATGPVTLRVVLHRVADADALAD